jgi:hypothetical protein
VVNRALRLAGWNVLRIWECALAKHPETCVRKVQRTIDTSPVSSDSLTPARSARSGPSPPANSFRCFPSNSSPRSRRRG